MCYNLIQMRSGFEQFLIEWNILTVAELVLWQADLDYLKIEDKLLAEGRLDKNELQKLKSIYLGLPFVDLVKTRIEPKVFSLIPESIVRRHNVVIFAQQDNTLKIALLDLADLAVVEFLREGHKIQIFLTTEDSLRHVLRHYQESLRQNFNNLTQQNFLSPVIIKQNSQALSLQHQAESPLAKELLTEILSQAERDAANEILFFLQDGDLLVKFKIRGKLYDSLSLTAPKSLGVVARLKMLADWKVDESDNQSGLIEISLSGKKQLWTIHALKLFNGEKLSLHLKYDQQHSDLSELGLDGINLELVQKTLLQGSGLIVLAGSDQPMLKKLFYAVLSASNHYHLAVASIEQKIQQILPFTSQTLLSDKLSLKNAVRAVLRQDDDILAVENINQEVLDLLSIHSQHNKLVIVSINAKTQNEVIKKLQAWNVLAAISLLIFQQSLPKLSAAKKYRLNSKQVKQLEKQINSAKLLQILRHHKIISDKQTWSEIDFYSGGDGKLKVGLYNVLPSILWQGKNADDFNHKIEQFLLNKTLTMVEDGVLKAVLGQVSLEQVLHLS